MLTDNHQIYRNCFVIIYYHLTIVSFQINTCIIFEPNEHSITLSTWSMVPPRAWDEPPTNWSQPDTVAKSKASTPRRFVVVEPSYSWWWPFKSPTSRKYACTSSACTAANDKKGKVFYGQEPPSGESTKTECGVNYQLLAVIYWSSRMGNS